MHCSKLEIVNGFHWKYVLLCRYDTIYGFLFYVLHLSIQQVMRSFASIIQNKLKRTNNDTGTKNRSISCDSIQSFFCEIWFMLECLAAWPMISTLTECNMSTYTYLTQIYNIAMIYLYFVYKFSAHFIIRKVMTACDMLQGLYLNASFFYIRNRLRPRSPSQLNRFCL